MRICLKMLTVFLLFKSAMAFESSLFDSKGKFSCVEIEKCLLPSNEEIEWIKAEFKSRSSERLTFLESYEEKAALKVESLLWRSMEDEGERGENNFSNFYHSVGSHLDKKLTDMRIETAKVLVSEGSPFIMELEDLQGVLSEGTIQRGQEKISAKERYYQWFNRASFKQLLQEMNDVKNKFFRKGGFQLSYKDKESLFPFALSACPAKLKKMIIGHFFSSDFEADQKTYKRILGRDQKLLQIKCVQTKKKGKLSPSFNSNQRKLELPYKLGKQRSVSPVKQLFNNVK